MLAPFLPLNLGLGLETTLICTSDTIDPIQSIPILKQILTFSFCQGELHLSGPGELLAVQQAVGGHRGEP